MEMLHNSLVWADSLDYSPDCSPNQSVSTSSQSFHLQFSNLHALDTHSLFEPLVVSTVGQGRMVMLFLGRNLDTSQPSGPHDPAPPLLRAAQAWLSFGSSLLRSAHPSHQKSSTFNEEPEKAPFPSQGSQICSHCTLIPRQLS
jgi:hypothetical protein